MKKGYTLGEALITLTIMGIVAAFATPSVIGGYQKRAVAAQVKKLYTDLSTAIGMAQMEHGKISKWDIPDSESTSGSKDFVETYIEPYINSLQYCSVGNSDCTCGMCVSSGGANYKIRSNGVGLSITAHDGTFYIIADIDGSRRASELGYDAFYFTAYENQLMPYGWSNDITRDDVLDGYAYTDGAGNTSTIYCTKSSRYACTALLMLDNWKFESDYPW